MNTFNLNLNCVRWKWNTGKWDRIKTKAIIDIHTWRPDTGCWKSNTWYKFNPIQQMWGDNNSNTKQHCPKVTGCCSHQGKCVIIVFDLMTSKKRMNSFHFYLHFIISLNLFWVTFCFTLLFRMSFFFFFQYLGLNLTRSAQPGCYLTGEPITSAALYNRQSIDQSVSHKSFGWNSRQQSMTK